jgi:hypothetical protein
MAQVVKGLPHKLKFKALSSNSSTKNNNTKKQKQRPQFLTFILSTWPGADLALSDMGKSRKEHRADRQQRHPASLLGQYEPQPSLSTAGGSSTFSEDGQLG